MDVSQVLFVLLIDEPPTRLSGSAALFGLVSVGGESR